MDVVAVVQSLQQPALAREQGCGLVQLAQRDVLRIGALCQHRGLQPGVAQLLSQRQALVQQPAHGLAVVVGRPGDARRHL